MDTCDEMPTTRPDAMDAAGAVAQLMREVGPNDPLYEGIRAAYRAVLDVADPRPEEAP